VRLANKNFKSKSKIKKKLKLKIKIGDTIKVIAGKNKGQTGKITLVDRINNRVIVENINMIVKHQKPNAQGQEGSLVRREASIHASNVMFLNDGVPTRLGICLNEVGKRIRFAKKDKKIVD
jgi:large subunit ribosomal protein L24